MNVFGNDQPTLLNPLSHCGASSTIDPPGSRASFFGFPRLFDRRMRGSRFKLSIIGLASFRLLLSGSGKKPQFSSNFYRDMLGHATGNIFCLFQARVYRRFSVNSRFKGIWSSTRALVTRPNKRSVKKHSLDYATSENWWCPSFLNNTIPYIYHFFLR